LRRLETIDQLTYYYEDTYRPDRLTRIVDAGNTTLGFKYNSSAGSPHYVYDIKGNLTEDKHKNMTVAYSHLNLPNDITVNANTIAFSYDADGIKLSKTAGGTTHNYVSGIEYNGSTTEAIYHAEGRCTPNGSNFYYEYTLKDHLGNARVQFRANGSGVTFLEESHYYAFGMQMAGLSTASPDNKYLYNGKELETEYGLDWSDYGARWYDAAVGRFPSQDRFAGKYSFQSIYAYGGGNPIKFIDVNGNSIKIIHKGDSYIYENGKIFLAGAEYTGKTKGFLKHTINALDKISKSSEGASIIQELSKSSNVFSIDHSRNNPKGYQDEFDPSNIPQAYANLITNEPSKKNEYIALKNAGISLSGGSGGNIYWGPLGSKQPTTMGMVNNPGLILAHEMAHALDANRGLMDDRVPDSNYPKVTRNEWQAVYRENLIRGQLKLPLRTHYLKSVDPSSREVLKGIGPKMLTSGGLPILPSWYKK
jgi:RHS repeat-associated protein